MRLSAISGVDQLISGLRLKLADQSKTGRSSAGGQSSAARGATPSAIQALAALDGVDDQQLKRALVQNLLAEHFDQDLIVDARFQQIVDRVTETLDQDENGGALLSSLTAALRAAAR